MYHGDCEIIHFDIVGRSPFSTQNSKDEKLHFGPKERFYDIH